MGEVYRATDTKLGREVAIKSLPAEVAADPDRLARFRREAQVLASLNHPRIAAIHGLEDIDGRPFLILELVEGEDLSERLKRGPLPVDEAFEIAGQIGEALEAAHERGIVHRDLKPANVKLTPDGEVKVLDFGLARAWAGEAGDSSPDLSASPTLAHTGTQAGVILGTAGYMSPEQARGRRVDKRADVWALGVVLFEMLTGRRLFEGETASEILAGVIKDEPEWSSLPPAAPPRTEAVLRRCLAKDPRARLRDAADVRLLLEEASQADESETASGKGTPGGRPWREALAWVTAGVALVVAGATVARGPDAADTAPPLTRFAVVLPDDQPLALTDVPILALSPDGRTLAFSAIDPSTGQLMIHIRPLDEPEPRKVPGTEGGTSPFFSPDGQSIAFVGDGRLKKVPVGGGPAVALADAPTARGGVWAQDDTIIFSPEYTSGLWRIPTTGGVAELVVAPDPEKGERTYRWPDLLPGGRTLLFTVGALDRPNNYNDSKIATYSVDTGKLQVVLEGANMARFVPPRSLVYSRAGVLYVVSFDPERLEVVGEPRPVIEGVGGDQSSGAGYYSLSRNGHLAYVAGDLEQGSGLITIFDREGQARRLEVHQRGIHIPRFSPDGGRLAYVSGVGASASVSGGDIWVLSLADDDLNRLTFDEEAAYPAWSPDGRFIAYYDTVSASVVRRAADGSGVVEPLTPSDPTALLPESWSPDGRRLAYMRMGRSSDVYLVEPGGEPRLFEEDASGPVFSPDGRWIAYAQPASGPMNVFVRPVEGEGKWQVSPEGGGYPRWRGDGREIFYLATRTGQGGKPVMAVEVESGEIFRARTPRRLFGDLPISRFLTSTAPVGNWDAAPSGEAFAFIEVDLKDSAVARIEVALHWAQHLEADARDTGAAEADR